MKTIEEYDADDPDESPRAADGAAVPRPGQFCHRHFSWLCQAGQGACQREEEG